MGLNTSKGNMYDFVSHTWNTVKGTCFHDCEYCYMKKWGQLKNPRFDESELKSDLGSGNFIFVGSSNDLFAEGNPIPWIIKTLEYCDRFDNRYLFQTKNPAGLLNFIDHSVFQKSVVCTTIESNWYYDDYMHNAPPPIQRVFAMEKISKLLTTYVTIEPIMAFDLDEMVSFIEKCNPAQVNIGADSGNNHLPEPKKEKVEALIAELSKFTTIHRKNNLKRILG